MKLYALFTLHKTGWGTRAGIGDPATATTAAQAEKNAAAESPSAPPVGGLGDDPHLYDSRQMSPPNQYAQPAGGYAQQDSYPMYDNVGYDGPHGDAQHYDVEMSQHRRV